MRRRSLYCITFRNGKTYIGIAFNPKARWAEHKRQARIGTDHPLYNAMRKYPGEAIFDVLYAGGDEEVMEMEISAIFHLQSDRHANGYNISMGGDLGSTGLKASEATRQKMSRARKGMKQTPEWTRRRADTQIGARRSDESREKMSAGQKRRVRTPEELGRMREMAKKAALLRQTPEYREKCRQSALRRWAKP